MAIFGNAANANVTVDPSAGNYGSATKIPVITVDSDKRISAINESSITLDATINSNASVGDEGSYAFLMQASGNTSYNPGQTLAGASLRYADATGHVSNNVTPGGTWRLMGYDSGSPRTNSGSGSGSGTGSGNISGNISGDLALQGGNIQGDASGTLQGGNVDSNIALSSGNVQGSVNFNVSGGISVSSHTHPLSGGNHNTKGASTGGNFSGNTNVSMNNLSVGGNVNTSNLGVSGNVSVSTENMGVAGNVPTDNATIGGNATVNSVYTSVNVITVVAYPASLWLRTA